jgi:hypothetical protein
MRPNPRVLAALLLATTLLAIALSGLFPLSARARDVKFTSITNERGDRLASAFAGISPNPLLLRVIQERTLNPPCPSKRSALGRVIDSLWPTAHAQDNGCQPPGHFQSCVEHNVSISYDNCTCNSENQYAVTGTGGAWSTGWQWDGNTICALCGSAECEVRSCNNACTTNDQCPSGSGMTCSTGKRNRSRGSVLAGAVGVRDTKQLVWAIARL